MCDLLVQLGLITWVGVWQGNIELFLGPGIIRGEVEVQGIDDQGAKN